MSSQRRRPQLVSRVASRDGSTLPILQCNQPSISLYTSIFMGLGRLGSPQFQRQPEISFPLRDIPATGHQVVSEPSHHCSDHPVTSFYGGGHMVNGCSRWRDRRFGRLDDSQLHRNSWSIYHCSAGCSIVVEGWRRAIAITVAGVKLRVPAFNMDHILLALTIITAMTCATTIHDRTSDWLAPQMPR